MRAAIWKLVRRRIVEGSLLPWWALIIRVVLYPLDFFYWRMSISRGYQWETDTWLIGGEHYSAEMLRALTQDVGVTYRVILVGGTVALQRVTVVDAAGMRKLLRRAQATIERMACGHEGDPAQIVNDIEAALTSEVEG